MLSAHLRAHVLQCFLVPSPSRVCTQQTPSGWPQEPRAQTLLPAAFQAEVGHTVCKTYFPERGRMLCRGHMGGGRGRSAPQRGQPGRSEQGASWKLLRRHTVPRASGGLAACPRLPKVCASLGVGTTCCSSPPKE